MPRRLGPLDRLRATQGCGIGSSCRSHATLEIESFPVFEARCTGSSNSQTVWPAGLELQLVCDDWGAGSARTFKAKVSPGLLAMAMTCFCVRYNR